MAKVKQQMHKMMSDEESSSINRMFEEMVGMRDCEAHIITPKIVRSRNTIKKIYQYLVQFATFKPLHLSFPFIKPSLDQIIGFTAELKEAIIWVDESEETEAQYATLEIDQVNKIYKTIKENKYMKDLINLGGRMKRFEKKLEENDDSFVMQEPGVSMFIFQFSSLDLKKLWAQSNITPMIKKYILTLLYRVFLEVKVLYEIVTSPDVDIGEFSSKLIQCIQALHKIPELNRCKNAFKKIEDSVNLLKENFGGYYREFMSCDNPNVIIENFIMDVSNKSGNNMRLTREFRVIIQYLHKESSKRGKNKDPNIQKLFNILNNKMGTSNVEEKLDVDQSRVDETVEINKSANDEVDDNTKKDNNNQDDDNERDDERDDNNQDNEQ